MNPATAKHTVSFLLRRRTATTAACVVGAQTLSFLYPCPSIIVRMCILDVEETHLECLPVTRSAAMLSASATISSEKQIHSNNYAHWISIPKIIRSFPCQVPADRLNHTHPGMRPGCGRRAGSGQRPCRARARTKPPRVIARQMGRSGAVACIYTIAHFVSRTIWGPSHGPLTLLTSPRGSRHRPGLAVRPARALLWPRFESIW